MICMYPRCATVPLCRYVKFLTVCRDLHKSGMYDILFVDLYFISFSSLWLFFDWMYCTVCTLNRTYERFPATGYISLYQPSSPSSQIRESWPKSIVYLESFWNDANFSLDLDNIFWLSSFSYIIRRLGCTAHRHILFLRLLVAGFRARRGGMACGMMMLKIV